VTQRERNRQIDRYRKIKRQIEREEREEEMRETESLFVSKLNRETKIQFVLEHGCVYL
jgi:hypothetical protein